MRLYHGTSTKNLNSILLQGLEEGSHVTSNEDAAAMYADDVILTLEIPKKALWKGGLDVYGTKTRIPKERIIKIVVDDGVEEKTFYPPFSWRNIGSE